MERRKTLIGYENINNVIFAKYQKEIVEDDGSITKDGIERSTITDEEYDTLKKSNFVNQILLDHAKEKHDIAIQRDALKAKVDSLNIEKSTLIAEKDKLLSEKSVLIAEKDNLIKAKVK